MNILEKIEDFMSRYIVYSENGHAFTVALWVMHTHCWDLFSTLPYLNITAITKQSGKTQQLDLLGFLCANARNLTAISAASMRRIISGEKPTVLFDEAEKMSSESASTMRQILAAGYRKGSKVPFPSGKNEVSYYDVFCPKAFAMIGDIQDVIRDRSIVINMIRCTDSTKYEEFVFDSVEPEGADLREEISKEIQIFRHEIQDAYLNMERPTFLAGREWDIWKPLFTLARIFASEERQKELIPIAVDISSMKSADARKYSKLLGEGAEARAQEDEYRIKLLKDMMALCESDGKDYLPTMDAIDRLLSIPTSPWRKFRGKGLDKWAIGKLFDQYGLTSKTVRVNNLHGAGNKQTLKAYRKEDMIKTAEKLGIKL
jgi:hypothetical protein